MIRRSRLNGTKNRPAKAIFNMKKNDAKSRSGAAGIHLLLTNAFPGRVERPDLQPLSHKECVEMRSRLISVVSSDLKFYLREVLEDLLRSDEELSAAPRKDGHSNIEDVVRYLDPQGGKLDYGFIESIYGKAGVEKFSSDEAVLLKEKLEDFRPFSKQEAAAISAWLTHVSSWPSLQDYIDAVRGALAFWNHRAAMEQ
jgi:hypothetical protein